MVRSSNPGGGQKTFLLYTLTDRHWGPNQPPLRWVSGFFSGGKQAEARRASNWGTSRGDSERGGSFSAPVLTSFNDLQTWRHYFSFNPRSYRRSEGPYCLHLQGCSSWIKIANICNHINHLKSTGYVMHHQFNIQQLYALPTLYLCVLYLSENKQRLVPLTA